MARALTVAIVRRAHKHFPNAGIVGVYAFEGREYTTKHALRIAVEDWCAALSSEQVPLVRKNFDLL